MGDLTGSARSDVPRGLLEALAADPRAAVSSERMAVAREHVQRRAFDDHEVVQEIAERLLLE